MPGVQIEEIGFDKDHMHTVMVIPPKYSIAATLGRLKSQFLLSYASDLIGLRRYTGKII